MFGLVCIRRLKKFKPKIIFAQPSINIRYKIYIRPLATMISCRVGATCEKDCSTNNPPFLQYIKSYDMMRFRWSGRHSLRTVFKNDDMTTHNCLQGFEIWHGWLLNLRPLNNSRIFCVLILTWKPCMKNDINFVNPVFIPLSIINLLPLKKFQKKDILFSRFYRNLLFPIPIPITKFNFASK